VALNHPFFHQQSTEGFMAKPNIPSDAESKASVLTDTRVLRVRTSGTQSRRRAGFEFTDVPVDIPLSQLSEEQVALITGDHYLSVLPTTTGVTETKA
jgi:hypothetical protein